MIIENCKYEFSPSETFEFTISAIGYAFCDNEWCAKVESPPCTRLYYVTDGCGEVHTDQGTVELLPGHLYMLPVGCSISYNCPDRMEKLYFHISLLNQYGTEVLFGINSILSIQVSQDHIKKLWELHNRGDVVSLGSLQALLQADVFAILAEHNIQMKSRRLSEVIQRAIAFIEENLSASLTVKTVADNSFISSANLSHKFKAEMGISVSQYIDGMVMYQAEQLLINTEWPLSRISTELGFYDQFYFSRRFKEKHTIPPLKYRKAHRVSKSSHETE